MKTLRTSVCSLFFILAANAFAQTGNVEYQCSSNGTLNGGYLVFTSDNLRAVAKHKDGAVFEISGTLGATAAMDDDESENANSASTTYAEKALAEQRIAAVMASGGLSGGMTGEVPPDREDIETSARRLDPRPGEKVPPKAGTNVEPRPGQRVPNKAGDDALAQSVGQRIQPRNGYKSKPSELALLNSNISFKAQLNSQGNISDISYRDGLNPASYVRIDSKSPTSNDMAYVMLNAELSNIKTYASCCTRNPASVCRKSVIPSAQTSLRTEKATMPQRSSAGGAVLKAPTSGAAAK